MWVMMKLKRTGQVMYFQCYDSRETAEMAIKVMNAVASGWNSISDKECSRGDACRQ